MATKVLLGLAVIAAIVEGLWAGMVPNNILPLALVVIGLVYAGMTVDPEDAGAYLVIVIAFGAASASDALGHIHVIGGYLDAIMDQLVVAAYAGVFSVVALRIWNRLTASDSE